MDQRLNGWDVSLDAPLNEDSDTQMSYFIPEDKISQEEQVATKQLNLLLNGKIKAFREIISERERDIFDNRIYSEDPLTLQKLGDRHNLSKERIRQLEKEIISRIKDYLEDELPDFNHLSEYKLALAG